MKKVRNLLFTAFLIVICLSLTVLAVEVRAADNIRVLPTDIRAFIDGAEIPACNIDGKLGVVAEDLRGYGFDVYWNAESWTLSITKNAYGVTSPIENINAKAFDNLPIYATNIVTFLDGNVVESFNIGGRTIVYFSALAKYGTYLYEDSSRASMISTDRHSFAAKTLSALPQKVIHAGGEIGGMLGSNSLEALDFTYSKGYRFIEIDFVLSSDGHPIALHDWSSYYSDSLTSTPISKAEFENVKIFNRFTSLTLDSLVEWMRVHPDVYIITDIKEDNVNVLRHIANEHPEVVSRLVPQIYQYDEYVPVRAMGYSNIILTLYRLPTYNEKANGKQNAAFAIKHNLLAVTGDVTLAKDGFVKAFVSAGVPLYVHTVNDEVEQQKYLDMGITGVYTDYAK